MAIITISRQLGSLGSKIARSLKEELGCNYLDKESLEQLMNKYGVSDEYVKKFDEKKPGFWENLSMDNNRYFHFMKKAILEFAQKGPCIILGRGAQILLADIPAVLKIRIIAPEDKRIYRIKGQLECDSSHALKILKKNDQDRDGFHKFFFNIDWASPELYDLTFSTNTFSEENIISTIKEIIHSNKQFSEEKETEEMLKDLCLGHEIITRIVYKENISVQFVEAIVKNGSVTLRGTAVTVGKINLCEEIARDTPGVKDVNNEISFIPISYGMA